MKFRAVNRRNRLTLTPTRLPLRPLPLLAAILSISSAVLSGGCAELANLEFDEGEGIFSLRMPTDHPKRAQPDHPSLGSGDGQQSRGRFSDPDPVEPPSSAGFGRRLQEDDVRLGLSMNEVTRVWGPPQTIEYADHPWSGNQRWVYPRHGLLPDRVVYFEAGTVTGWESPQNLR